MNKELSQETLKGYLSYNERTGYFTRIKSNNPRFLGLVDKGYDKDGYQSILVAGRYYKAHRLVWLYVYGYLPDTDIDHINQEESDNRLSNLRLASRSKNNCNSKLRSDNTSGIKGVSWNKEKKKWHAYISHEGEFIKLGMYSSIDEAGSVVGAARTRLHREFARHG